MSAQKQASSKRVILVDNYDSFTWNIYQYLCQEGANVEVYRNDKISVSEIEAKDYDIIVLSPGPGHPVTDSGICQNIIRHFAGKKPIFGICLGQQAMYHVFGGIVEYAGEIVHGKTSTITHDGKGMFKGVPQGISVTRYHSLAGNISSLPDELVLTAKTDGGIVMGVRHKKYVIEGVQFHPESILTEEGHLMIRNLLSYSAATWEEQEKLESSYTRSNIVSSGKKNILHEIYAQRKQDYKIQEAIPGQTFNDLETLYSLGLAPSVLDFYKALKDNIGKKNSVLGEIKRASPSKGDIALNINALHQAERYAKAGVTAISVLTEPHWFKGSIEDLKNIRKLLDKHSADTGSRPLLLRKEFIFNKYQILEARLAGADTVLLIVKMLDVATLKELYQYSVSLGMEPLVEVNTVDEMKSAVELGAKVIGVNNRDLTTFNVDLNKSSSLVSLLPKDSILLALSGIFDKETAAKYHKEGIQGFLVGEALMKANDPAGLIKELNEA
ncbi:bifunctional anthranilate synthase/indole-3-glycerol-phosphate synthase [Saccharomycopsis crataegensis]|uniref:Multifunctional tryptophan biosynthesis protein n=1 Tax=Saccharomycopsis crataegensis TaxID=43959 RepID=A0AAV5QMK6_9ASCO|nr:bifunctional anthranilate synthase/indole-3-glycerol-phosphate synthase [Saccharomycopsis crataegensis]